MSNKKQITTQPKKQSEQTHSERKPWPTRYVFAAIIIFIALFNLYLFLK